MQFISRLKLILMVTVFSALFVLPAEGQSEDYHRQMSQLNTAEARVRETTTRLRELTEQKKTSTDPQQRAALIQEMIQAHSELRGKVVEYNRLRDHVRYRFPAQGEEVERLYRPIRAVSLEEIEEVSRLDQALTQTLQRIERHFGSYVGEDSSARGPASGSGEESPGRSPSPLRNLKLSR